MKKFWTMLALLVLATSPMAQTAAQSYPSKPIKLIVPFPPGGGTDIFARAIAQKLQDSLKWTVVVENKAGAGGNLGVEAAAKSAPDGYTVVLGQTSNLAVNPTLYPKLPYDPLKDLSPVVLLASAPLVLVTRTESNLKTYADVVLAAKAKQGQLSVGSPGNGTVAHLSIELLQKQGGFKVQHIPYRGSAQALTDLMGGSIELYMSSVPTALGHIKSGKLRAIAVTGERASLVLPSVPTVSEAGKNLGMKGFETSTWFGFAVPVGTPPEAIRVLNTEINKLLKLADVRAKLQSEGGDVLGGSPEQFASLLRTDLVRWGRVVRESGAKID